MNNPVNRYWLTVYRSTTSLTDALCISVGKVRVRIDRIISFLTIFLITLITRSALLAADTDPLYWSAEENLRNGRFDSAIYYFDEIIRFYPLKKESYFNRGLAYYHSSRFPEAIADFDECLKMDTDFKDAQYMKAITLEKSGALNAAISEFEKLGDYKEANKRIKNYRFSVYISENWYYMIAILFLVIILLAVVAKMLSYKDW